MHILVAGNYEADYNRSKIIFDGLAARTDVTVTYYQYKKRRKINIFHFRKLAKQADIIFVPSFGHRDVSLIKLLTNKPVIFDPLVSRYLTKVFDFKKVKPWSPKAFKNFLKDKISMSLANLVLCDTAAHLKYYKDRIGINPKKMRVLPVGVNTEEFFPLVSNDTTFTKKFTVGFYGSFIPLQGIKKIIDAAYLLRDEKDIQFNIIGSGFDFAAIEKLANETYQLDNINFLGWVKYDALANALNEFDIALGIFGDTPKAALVIPNKIYHYAAINKPIITKDTVAIKEIFTNEKNIFLIDGSAESLAAQIIQLKNNASIKQQVAQNGYDLVSSRYNHHTIATMFLQYCQEAIAKQ